MSERLLVLLKEGMIMTERISSRIAIVLIFGLVFLSCRQEATPKEIPGKAGTEGGLIVHIGCGDGRLTAMLRREENCLVHGLDTNRQMVARARENVRSRGVYGAVSIDHFDGRHLPYIDNLVNTVVASKPTDVPKAEILRVLRPRGVAYIREGDRWTTFVKPWPDDIDEWTHYLHDASNNAVAHDTAIGPLRHLQWDGAPRYSRHHEYTSSVAAMVSAQGRLFSIIDMGSRASIHMPAKWRLTARDAFNGIVLWERPIASWFNHLWPLKDGPAQPPRRLVAAADAVYVTLGLEAPVSRLNAATGKTEHVYDGTEFTEEILHCDGALVLLKNDESMNPAEYYPKLMICWDEKRRTMKESEGFLLTPQPRTLLAVDTETGQTLWKVKSPVEPLTLATDAQNVYFHNWNRIVCLDRKTGQEKWQSEPVMPRKSMGYVYGPTLVAYKDVVLFADGRLKRQITALSKEDGRLLWEAPHYPAGHAGSPEDLLVVDDLVWCGKIAGGRQSGVFTGRDPLTGEVKREFTPAVDTYWFHHRCHRAKATDNYILTSRTGIEFVDIKEQNWETHHWVRGACTYGILPCNGLVYAPPHPCACYSESKMTGISALAPATQRSFDLPAPAEGRLLKGPAYGKPVDASSENADQWPTYRHDAARSGATAAAIPTALNERWKIDLGRTPTSPVVADGRAYVATPDDHRVHCLNADSGQGLWTFTTGGGVDSPPTVYRGLAIFGSADGCVYCLRASDGALVWRFRAAPYDQRLISYGRVESVWPVHGSVLVHKGQVYCMAGRSTFLDGGLRFCRLDAVTGALVSEQILDDQSSPQKDVKVLNMPVAQTDILSTDGQMIYMRSQAFDPEGRRLQTLDPNLTPIDRAIEQLGEGTHLFSPTGFLDDDAWHRSYWLYGKAFSSGCNWWFRAGRYAPAGRLLTFDGQHVYGFGRRPGLFVWSHVLENHLFCSVPAATPEAIDRVKQWSQKSGRDAVFNRHFTMQAPLTDRLAPQLQWSVAEPPLHARAMVATRDTLWVAGPPDVLDENEAYERPQDAEIKAAIARQDAAYEGDHGASLLGLSKDGGQTVAQLKLPAIPVWDGMVATQGHLFVAARDGSVLCLGSK